MDFSLSEEQELLRDTARTILEKECPPALVRSHLEDASVGRELFDGQLRDWAALGEGPVVDLCLFAEEAGAHLLPGPWFATAALFVPLLSAAGHEHAAPAAAGEVTGTVALAGASGLPVVSDDPIRTLVPEVGSVESIAVVLPGPSVAVVPAGDLAHREVATLDGTRRLFEVEVPAGLAGAPLGEPALELAIARATVALAADLVGVSRWLVDAAVAYAKERVQFGRPIGSFQGVQFTLVDRSLDHERATAAVYYAAMALDAGDPHWRSAVHVAKAAAGTAAKRAARASLQVHGGVGYTWEHDLHLYLRRAFVGDDLLGDASWHHDRLASVLLDRGAPQGR